MLPDARIKKNQSDSSSILGRVGWTSLVQRIEKREKVTDPLMDYCDYRGEYLSGTVSK